LIGLIAFFHITKPEQLDSVAWPLVNNPENNTKLMAALESFLDTVLYIDNTIEPLGDVFVNRADEPKRSTLVH
jgi:hypothetical protein